MLLYRIEHTAQAVHILLVAVCTHVEPCVALQCYSLRYASHGKEFLATYFLQSVAFVVDVPVCRAEILETLFAHAVDYSVELLTSEACYEALCSANMLAEQVPYDILVFRTHHQLEYVVLAFVSFLLLVSLCAAP